jgi:hypothetical protein
LFNYLFIDFVGFFLTHTTTGFFASRSGSFTGRFSRIGMFLDMDARFDGYVSPLGTCFIRQRFIVSIRHGDFYFQADFLDPVAGVWEAHQVQEQLMGASCDTEPPNSYYWTEMVWALVADPASGNYNVVMRGGGKSQDCDPGGCLILTGNDHVFASIEK